MGIIHNYQAVVEWTGNKGSGTFDYRSYSRSHTIKIDGKPNIMGSSDSSYRGEKSKHNPEDLFVSAMSACHMLWYLHLCADHGVVVLKYEDRSEGTMEIDKSGSGRFTSIVLHPMVVISGASDRVKALDLHHQAHEMCFLANSVSFPITYHPEIVDEA
jgi:Predicted redox protein, regulator of disulfide bond formation